MIFEEKRLEYEAFRQRIIPMLMTALPVDQAACYDQRARLEPLYFEAMELAADLESFYLGRKMLKQMPCWLLAFQKQRHGICQDPRQ